MIALRNEETLPPLVAWPSAPSSFSWISTTLLPIRKRPPISNIRLFPVIGASAIGTVNSTFVRLITQEIEHSKITRVTSASVRPSLRALSCCSGGSLPARIEIKITLSIPSTISNAVSVSREIQICGSVSHSIISQAQRRPHARSTHRCNPSTFPAVRSTAAPTPPRSAHTATTPGGRAKDSPGPDS